MNSDIAEIVHAIQQDAELSGALVKVLDRPPIERADLIKKLAFNMKANQAPEDLIGALLKLQSSDLANEVLAVLKKV